MNHHRKKRHLPAIVAVALLAACTATTAPSATTTTAHTPSSTPETESPRRTETSSIKAGGEDSTVTISPTIPPPATTTTTPPHTHTPSGGDCPEYTDLARQAGWPEPQLPKVTRIMWRESRCDPNARSRTRDTGLMQINDVHLPWLAADYSITPDMLYDPWWNLVAALAVWHQQGWGAWTSA